MPRLSLLGKLLSVKAAAAVRHGDDSYAPDALQTRRQRRRSRKADKIEARGLAKLLSTRHDPLAKAIRKGQRGRWREIDEFDRRVKGLKKLARADRSVLDQALVDLTQRTHEPITAHLAWDLLVALRAVEKEYSET